MSEPFLGKITTAANSNAQRLSSLIKGTVGSGGNARYSTRYSNWTITNDAASGEMYIGGASVSSTEYAVVVLPGFEWSPQGSPVMNNLVADNFWVRFASNSQAFHFRGQIA